MSYESRYKKQTSGTGGCGCLLYILAALLASVLGRYDIFWIWGVWPGYPQALLFCLIAPVVDFVWLVLAILHMIPGITWPLIR